MLLVKTLAFLFGEENKITSPNSIKFENNFRRFMQLDYKSSDFLNKDFNKIIFLDDFEKLQSEINDIILKTQQYELLDRIKHFSPLNEQEFKNSIFIYVLLFELCVPNQISEIDILRNLATTIELYINIQKKLDKGTFSKWIIKNIFDSPQFKVETQLKLIGYLWESKQDNGLWNIKDAELKKIALKKYDEYLEKYTQNLWDVNDFTFYSIFYKIETITDIKNELITRFLSFLSTNTIEIFCIQSTEFGGNYGELLKVSNGVTNFFSSKEDYKLFIEKHKDSQTNSIKEYIKFLELQSISNYSIDTAFTFNHFTLFKYKNNQAKNQYPEAYKEKESKVVQLFLKIHSLKTYEYLSKILILNDSDYRISDFKFFTHKNGYYAILTHYYGKDVKHILAYGSTLFDVLKNIHPHSLTRTIKNRKIIIQIDSEILISTYSIQP